MDIPKKVQDQNGAEGISSPLAARPSPLLSDDFLFSQSALQDYTDCPKRFELRYLREVRWPALETQAAIEYEGMIEQGKRFHHLVHQHGLGVPAEALESTIRDAELRTWWSLYRQWETQHLPAERHPELSLVARFGGKLLVAKYDLVARKADGGFLIIDWKTGKPPKRKAYLTERMQSLVYPLVLAQAGDWLNGNQPIAPEQITMVYWFAEGGQTVEIPLNRERFIAMEQRLLLLLSEVEGRTEFSMTTTERHCGFCVYRSLCGRGETAGALEDMEDGETEMPGEITVDLDSLEEIAF